MVPACVLVTLAGVGIIRGGNLLQRLKVSLSPHSNRNWVRVGYQMQRKSTQKNETNNEMYMANARNLRLGPNATYIPLTCIGVSRWGLRKL